MYLFFGISLGLMFTPSPVGMFGGLLITSYLDAVLRGFEVSFYGLGVHFGIDDHIASAWPA